MKKEISPLVLWRAWIKNFLRGDFLRAKKLSVPARLALLIAEGYKREKLVFLTDNKKKYRGDVSFIRRFKLLRIVKITPHIDISIKGKVILCDSIYDIRKIKQLYQQNNILVVVINKSQYKKVKEQFNANNIKTLFEGDGDNGRKLIILDKPVTDACDNLTNLPGLRIQAIITCYNEKDITEHTIKYLIEQGIHVHIINNWATDGSGEIIKRYTENFELVTSEKFPKDGPSKTFDWGNLLERVQEIAKSNADKFDWFIHHDVDEVREAPFSKISSLKKGIEIVDACGFNAINHTVINFGLTKDGFDSSQELDRWFRYFSFGEKKNFHHKQIKAWKTTTEIKEFVSSGGHLISFDGQRVFPYRFLLKHYPLRSVKQAKRKIFIDRKKRFNLKERKKRWHIQYDSITEKTALLADKDNLIKYNRKKLYHQYLLKSVFNLDK